ncbi:hypothetical protein O181_009189 [Austropuccinia psidii MF-1]|uniref:Uncharacterized protein n=1 Tax=Austropuccinia psidii MF-1 TaxID=1389203 RepID=A0A9Q3BQC1_9BASI|nr:hypothetical protein [Austropuccinia psidii MF-1]
MKFKSLEVQCSEEKEESGQASAIYHDTPAEEYPIENIKAFFEVTKVYTHLKKYIEDCSNLTNIQEARMCKAKPDRGKGYTSGESCITSMLMNDVEAKVSVDTFALCTFVGRDYLKVILPQSKNHLLPIKGVKFSSATNNMYHSGILDTNLVFPHTAGSMRMKTEIIVMNNCTSQNIIIGNDYLKTYGIDINNHK